MNIEQAILRAYRQADSGNGTGVFLKDLRPLVKGFSKEQVSKALFDMMLDSKLSLFMMDDPQMVRAADDQAAVNVGGEDRHIVYVKY